MNDLTDYVNPIERIRKHGGGPKTLEGKKRSSMNALKHGLTARSAMAQQAIEEMCGPDFQELLEQIRAQYQPKDILEEMLTRRIALCLWRFTQTEVLERRMFEKNEHRLNLPMCHDNIMKCECLVDIHLYRAMRTLFRKRQLEDVKKVQQTNSSQSQPERGPTDENELK